MFLHLCTFKTQILEDKKIRKYLNCHAPQELQFYVLVPVRFSLILKHLEILYT